MVRKLLLPAILLSALCLCACRSDAIDPVVIIEPDLGSRSLFHSLSGPEREILRGDNAFGVKLFSELAAADQGNIVVSPLSVSIALTMAYNGARGKTAEEMAAVLGFGGMEREAVNALYARLIRALEFGSGGVDLSLANSIWSVPELVPEKEFLDLNRNTFGARVSTLDFQSAGAADAINGWVSESTRGLIPGIVEAPLDGDLVMLLINALYFKGDWSTSFDPESTYKGQFHLEDGTTKGGPMMTSERKVLYFQDGKAAGVELPYGDSLYSMVLMLPGAEAGMPGLLQALQDGALEGWLAGGQVRSGPIHVPKFKVEYRKTLNQALMNLGMVSAFGPGADLTGISKVGRLEISKVLHKTYVSVDEKGTEAAAVTSVGVRIVSLPSDLLRLDRPFVFAIRERTTGTLIFLGLVRDPWI